MPRELQYKDTDAVLNTILEMRTKCYSDREIMQRLNMAQATYYRYKARVLDAMQPYIAARRSELIAQELQMTQDRLEQQYRVLQDTIDNPATKNKERIEAVKAQRQIAIDIAKLQVEAPKVLMQHEQAKLLVPENKEKDKDTADADTQAH